MNVPKVGVEVLIKKNNKVLLGKRKKSHGTNTWAPPGGHLEFGESIEECAKREVLEETGIQIKNPKIVTLTNDIFKEEGKHYITIFLITDTKEEPIAREPELCEKWEWFSWYDLPKPLFLPIQNLLKQGFNPFG